MAVCKHLPSQHWGQCRHHQENKDNKRKPPLRCRFWLSAVAERGKSDGAFVTRRLKTGHLWALQNQPPKVINSYQTSLCKQGVSKFLDICAGAAADGVQFFSEETGLFRFIAPSGWSLLQLSAPAVA
jgi:hypothetical protein